MDVYIKEGRVYGLLKNRKILKLTLDNQSLWISEKSILTETGKKDKIKPVKLMTRGACVAG